MTYSFELKIPVKKAGATAFSCPQSNEYQHISKLAITPPMQKNYTFIKPTTIKFEATLLANNKTIPNKLSLHDYSSSQKKTLVNDSYVNGLDPKIISLSRKIKGESVSEIIENTYNFVLEYLQYGNPIDGLYTYNSALENKVTDCGGFSMLLASLLQSRGIPTRLAVGFLLRKNFKTKVFALTKLKPLTFENLSMHAWLEALLPNGQYFPLDTSIDWKRRKGLSQRSGGFGFIPADRLVTSFGHSFTVRGHEKNTTLELLQKPIQL